MSSTELQRLERDIKEAQQFVELGNALERLKNNRDFKLIVLKGYFEQEAIRLVHLKSDANMQGEGHQHSILRQMDAIGTFGDYLNTLRLRADMAKRTVEAGESVREDLLAEGN